MLSAAQTNVDRPWLDPNARPQILIESVNKTFGAFTAVDSINLRVFKGEMFALVGASGCGKTTLLRMLAGFETPSNGRILIEDTDMTRVPPHERPVNMMFQSYALFPHMSVEDNVGYGLKRLKLPAAVKAQRIRDALDMVQLGSLAKRKPHQLSGGQRQRVALARALAREPEVLLLDEPLSALDAHLRQQMQIELKQIQARLGLTFIIVTHDQAEALTLADRIVVMNHGVIAQIGTPAELYDRPSSPFVARFLGAANLLPCRLTARNGGTAMLEIGQTQVALDMVGETVPAATDLLLCVRPERLLLLAEAAPGRSLAARVESRMFLGLVERVQLRLADDTIVMLDLPHRGSTPPIVGTTVHLGFEPGTVQLFEADASPPG